MTMRSLPGSRVGVFGHALLAACLFAGASVALAQGLSAPGWLKDLLPGQSSAPPPDPMARLNLTEEQRTGIAALAEQQAKFQLETATQVAQIQSRLPVLYAAPRLDEVAIDEVYARIFELQRELIVHAARIFNAQIDLLDEEQRAIWSALRSGQNPETSGRDIERIRSLEPDPDNGLYAYQLCADCHAPEGWGESDGSVPVLAGQHRRVLIKQLIDIRHGHRGNESMFSFAQDSEVGGDQAISDVTHYIAGLPMPPSPGIGSGDRLDGAPGLYAQYCASCHGDEGEGNDALLYPRLHGQHFGYLDRQMERIVSGDRGNSDPAMVDVLRQLSPSQRESIADYLSRKRPDAALVAAPGWRNPDFVR
jgi:cytochrome c553